MEAEGAQIETGAERDGGRTEDTGLTSAQAQQSGAGSCRPFHGPCWFSASEYLTVTEMLTLLQIPMVFTTLKPLPMKSTFHGWL